MSERYDCTDPEGRAEGIPAAAAAVRRGEVVVLPTDTVYGIGCDAFDADRRRLRPRGQGPRPRHAAARAHPDRAHGAGPGDAGARLRASGLMEKFWPGPLTLVLKAQTSLHWDLGDTNGTVALRVPDARASPSSCSATSARWRSRAPTRPATPRPAPSTRRSRMLGESVAVYLDGGPVGERRALDDHRLHRRTPVTLRLGAVSQQRSTRCSLAAHRARGRAAPVDEPTDRAGEPDAEPREPAEPTSRRRAGRPATARSQTASQSPRTLRRPSRRRNRVGSRSRTPPDPPGDTHG